MNKKFSTILGLGMLVLLGAGFYYAISATYHAFRSLESDVAIAVVAGCTTILGSALALVLGRHYEARRDREAAHREKKVELFDDFTKRLFTVFTDAGAADSDDLVNYLREIHRKLMLWSGPKSVIAYANWHKLLTSQGNNVRAESIIKMADFFLALREDLGHSNKGITRDHIVQFILQNSGLIMSMYRRNPNVTMAEVIEAENILNERKTKG